MPSWPTSRGHSSFGYVPVRSGHMESDTAPSLADPTASRHDIEERGRELARELDIDEASFLVASNIHWAFTLMRTLYERGPLAEEKLSMSAFVALWALRVSGEMEGRAVAEEVGIARSSFSGLATRLEKRGLIRRREHPADGRAVLYSLTEEGRVVIDRAWPRVNRAAGQLSSHLGEVRQRELADALRSVADQLTLLLEGSSE